MLDEGAEDYYEKNSLFRLVKLAHECQSIIVRQARLRCAHVPPRSDSDTASS